MLRRSLSGGSRCVGGRSVAVPRKPCFPFFATRAICSGMTDPRLILMEAIATRRLVVARYNGNAITLAPHVLFERHGDLAITAVNPNKARRSDEEPTLGQFKLAGLSAVEITDEPFEPLATCDGAAPRSDDAVILSV